MAVLLAASSGVVVRPAANLYSNPSEDSDVVSQAIYASAVGIVEDRGAWVKVRTPDDYTGWIQAGSVRRLAEGERHYGSGDRVAQVENLFANLYREPSITKHPPLLTVPFETRLEVVAEPDQEERRWIQVRLPDDRAAWVQRGDVSLEPKVLTIQETIGLGKRFLGLPYRWGGTSSFGYDCSGFMQMLCRRRGINLPRDAKPQANWSGAHEVERSQIELGDLLYFGPSLEKIDHTGMYIGDGMFLHASARNHPVIQVSRLGDEPWATLLVAARRVN